MNNILLTFAEFEDALFEDDILNVRMKDTVNEHCFSYDWWQLKTGYVSTLFVVSIGVCFHVNPPLRFQ
jgi:hypothetical protein